MGLLNRLNKPAARPGNEPLGYYLVGEPGWPNYGDELIAREWLRYLAQRHPDKPVFLDCTQAGQTAARLYREHPLLTVVDTTARLARENSAYRGDGLDSNVAAMADFVVRALTDDGLAANCGAGIQILHNHVRTVHFIGGGYLCGTWPVNLARLGLAEWAHSRGIRTAATGEGFYPTESDRLEYLKKAAEAFDVLTVRDEKSRDLLAPMDSVQVSPDDCFINGLDGVCSDRRDLPKIMVCAQTDQVHDQDALQIHVLGILRAWGVDYHERIGVVECYPYVDYPIFRTLNEAGYNVELFPAGYLLRDGFPACEGQTWISTRYHPHLIAAARGAQGVYVPVGTEYYDVKHRAVVRMGSQWREARIGEDVPMPGNGFKNDSVRYRYRDQIRESVENLYE